MKSPRAIYQELCEAPDLSAAVAGLPCEELTAVAGYVAKLKNRGIAAQVWGVIQEALTEKGQEA